LSQSKLLIWLARIVYAFLLPVYLFYFALNSHYQVKLEQQKASFREQMGREIDLLADYHSDERFFHALLQVNFIRADNENRPYQAMQQLIQRLKERFPDTFKFIVMNRSGKIDRRLSDENRYFYVIRSMFDIMKKLAGKIDEGVAPDPESDELIAGKIGLLRSYFGQFMMEKHLVNPLKKGYLGSCLRISEDSDKALVWYQVCKNFAIICFIDEKALGKNIGPRMICRKNNLESAVVKSGYYNPQNFVVGGSEFLEKDANEIRIRAGEFLSSAVSFVESRSFLLGFRQVVPDLIVFSYIDRANHLIDPQQKTLAAMFHWFKWLIVIVFILYCLRLRFSSFYFSIKHKLFLLFLFTNGLPLLIMVSTGYEYFEQKKMTMINSINNESARFLKEFDNRYPAQINDIAQRLNQFIGQELHFSDDKPSESSLRRLSAFIKNLEPDEAYLYDVNGNQMLTEELVKFQTGKFAREFFSKALEFYNHSDVLRRHLKKTVLEKISDDASVFNGILESMSRMTLQNFGSGNRWTYLKLLGDRENYRSWGFLAVTWKPETLMKKFFSERIKTLNKNIFPRRLIVMEKDSEEIFPANFAQNSHIRRIFHRTKSRKLMNESEVIVDGKSYVCSSLVGIELADAVLMSLYPSASIHKSLEDLLFQIKLSAFASLFIVFIIIRFFSGRFAKPVNLLARGVEEVGRQNFSFRVDYRSKDEFGDLIKGFNETVSGMKELAIGTAVQESLLPEEHARFGRLEIFARSIFMSRMGGDYYDYYKIGEDKSGVFFGDVAGHGIPAAMIMAMAKAVVAAHRQKECSPAKFLELANSIFLHLKEKGWRRMMTGLCLEINNETGVFRLANAGQCFPIVVSAKGASARYVKALGMPLGNKTRKGYSEIEDKLEPGDTLILYTDGIIEATNADGEVFAFERFEALMKNAWNSDLTTYWHDIFKAYNAWTAAQDDDITFLMVKYD
jgi:hypothetical protein